MYTISLFPPLPVNLGKFAIAKLLFIFQNNFPIIHEGPLEYLHERKPFSLTSPSQDF
jgi:hypothetical protein